MNALWPDLRHPPTGWTVARRGTSLHLSPPATAGAHPQGTMIVSPLVPVSAQLPEPAAVLAQTLSAEVAAQGIRVVRREEPVPWGLPSGLAGVRWEIEVELAGGVRQVRGYGAWKDAAFLYGLHLLAAPEAWAALRETWLSTAEGVAPPP